jgi:hypothetical protein
MDRRAHAVKPPTKDEHDAAVERKRRPFTQDPIGKRPKVDPEAPDTTERWKL